MTTPMAHHYETINVSVGIEILNFVALVRLNAFFAHLVRYFALNSNTFCIQFCKQVVFLFTFSKKWKR